MECIENPWCDESGNAEKRENVIASVDLPRRELSDDLLRTHVPRRAGDRAARIRTRTAVRNGGPVAERIEVRRGICGELAIEEGLSADEHRVVEIAAGKEKELLQVARRKKSAPRAVFGIGDVSEELRLHRGLDIGKRVAARIQRDVLEEERDPIEWLDEAELPHCRPFAIDLDVTGRVVRGAVEDAQRRGLELGDRGDGEDESEGGVCAFIGRELLVEPPHGATEEERELPARAGESLLLDLADHRLVADESRGGERIGGEEELIIRDTRRGAIALDVDDFAIGIDSRQLWRRVGGRHRARR